jgi:cellulose synthase/poly-beta-1,6-N-acetylglucosamine synthase-like glycosyltransferase
VNVLYDALVLFSIVSFVYFVVLNSLYLGLTVVAWIETRRDVKGREYLALDEVFRSPLTPGISVLVPAFNEQAVIVESVRSLLALHYPRHEVVVANDGSTDATLEALVDAFDLAPVRVAMRDSVSSATVRATYVSRRHPNLLVVDKENGGRSDALNAALRVARHPYVCVIDADSLLEDDALLMLAKPILDDPQLLVAAGGTIRVANGCRVDHGQVVDVRLPSSRLATIQALEYLRSFIVARVAWSRMNALGIISGAFGLFHRDLVETVGGYWTETVGEDFELTMRLHRHLKERDEPYRITFAADPVCWTEVPEQFGTLARQRRRWQRGCWETLRRHHRMMFNPRYGAIGMVGAPYFMIFEFFSPVFTLLGLVVTITLFLLGEVTAIYFFSFLFISLGLGVFLTVSALALEEVGHHRYERRADVFRLLAYSVLENFGFHQLHDMWRAMGYVDIARGTTSWGAQQRRGFDPLEPDARSAEVTAADADTDRLVARGDG